MEEEVLRFGRRRTLVGVVTDPGGLVGKTPPAGVIFLNAGLLHRVGPNRMFVTAARRLAASGIVSLRFDHSGIGDSAPRHDKLSFEKASVIEAQEAMNFLARTRGCRQFYLVGLCSGSLTAFRAACSDTRIIGLVLLNALLENPDTIDQDIAQRVINRRIARSYWTEKLFKLKSWKRLLTGATRPEKIFRVTRETLASELQGPAKSTPSVDRVIDDLEVLSNRGTAILFVFGEDTTFLEYFRVTLQRQVAQLSGTRDVTVEILPDADHTFTRLRHQDTLLSLVEEWICGRALIGKPVQQTGHARAAG